MMKKKMLLPCLFMVILLAFPCGVQAAFTDVSPTDWFAPSVNYCAEKGYITGITETEFAPQMHMTRAMLVKMLYRCADTPTVTAENKFPDVAAGKWYEAAVRWGATEKIVAGYEDGTFRPDKEVTREETMAFIYRYLRYKGQTLPATADQRIFDSFPDAADTAKWSAASVQWCLSVGILSGSEGMILPTSVSTRAQMASILRRIDAYLDKDMVSFTSSAGENGTIKPQGTFSVVRGSSFTFRFIADSGYRVDTAYVNGVSIGSVKQGAVSMSKADQTITVTFKAMPGDPTTGMGQLVNRTYPILNAASNSYGDLTTVKYGVSGRNVQMRAEAATALNSMIGAYKANYPSMTLKAQSGYRTYAYQTTLYKNQVSRKSGNIYRAGVVSAIPGTSEHELGLAVDLTIDGSLTGAFGSTHQGQWLAAHCHEFGYILRYPADKQLVTGIIYEPWHFRYVGTAITTAMDEKGITTLEEYYELPLAEKDITPYAPYLQ